MTAAGKVLGAALFWVLVLVACVVLIAVCVPLLAVDGVVRAVWAFVGALGPRGEMSGTPDDLDDVLRARIDGDGEAGRLACGCVKQETSNIVGCLRCQWETCYQHKGATHLCEPDPIDRWQYAPDRDPMRVDRLFDALAAGAELADLHNAPHDLSRYYLIGDEK